MPSIVGAAPGAQVAPGALLQLVSTLIQAAPVPGVVKLVAAGVELAGKGKGDMTIAPAAPSALLKPYSAEWYLANGYVKVFNGGVQTWAKAPVAARPSAGGAAAKPTAPTAGNGANKAPSAGASAPKTTARTTGSTPGAAKGATTAAGTKAPCAGCQQQKGGGTTVPTYTATAAAGPIGPNSQTLALVLVAGILFLFARAQHWI